jgi:hypothetical protein
VPTTALGTPYVSSSDYVSNYPTVSQSLANSIDALPRGLAAYAQRTTSQGSVTTVTDLTSLTVTFTANASRYYLIQGFVTVNSSVGGDACGLIIANSSNTALATAHVHSATNVIAYALNVAYRVAPGAGSVTYKLRGQRGAGTGNLTYTADSTTPSFIMVTDIGPV